jgi:hypothetical protein
MSENEITKKKGQLIWDIVRTIPQIIEYGIDHEQREDKLFFRMILKTKHVGERRIRELHKIFQKYNYRLIEHRVDAFSDVEYHEIVVRVI